MRDLVSALVVPQGFTLSIAGTLAATISQRGMPGIFDVWLFVVGASLSFAVLAVLGGSLRTTARSRPLLVTGTRSLNVVPVAAMPGATLGAGLIPNSAAGYFVAGILASALYIVLLAAMLRLTGGGLRRGAP